MKWKKVRILKKSLNITFINLNTEEQIVQAMAGVLAYNLAENDENIKFLKEGYLELKSGLGHKRELLDE